MSGAALLLALALVVAPSVPHRRLGYRRLVVTSRWRIAWTAAAIGVTAVAVAVTAPVPVTLATGVVVATAVMRRRRRMRLLRRSAESAELLSALGVLVGELRVGAHPVDAFGAAAGEVDGQVAVRLRTVAARARLGADVTAGLRSAARRSPLAAHWERLAACWHLAQTHGLAIAPLMDAAHRDITERERFADRVGAGMAGARATGAVLAGLPVLGLGMGQLIGAYPLRFLLSGGAGGWLLVIGVILACAGLLWSDRITAGATT